MVAESKSICKGSQKKNFIENSKLPNYQWLVSLICFNTILINLNSSFFMVYDNLWKLLQHPLKDRQQLVAFRVMPASELFKIERMKITLTEFDMLARPKKRVQCEQCGDWMQVGRDIKRNNTALCILCAEGKYYKPPA